MTIYYIDPEAGSNSNNGTSTATPKRDFTNFSNAFVGGNSYLVKCGTRLVTSSGTRANIIATGTGPDSPVYVGPYGTGAPPILDGNGTFHPFYIKSGSYITIDGFDVTNAAGAGIFLEATSSNLSHITIKNCRVYRTGVSGLTGSDAISVQKAVDGGTATDILIRDCVVSDCYNHGIKARTGANGVTVLNCIVRSSGKLSPSHGMGTASNAAAPSSWTLISGNVYEATVSTTGLLTTNNSSWELVYASGKNGYFHLTASATPLTPGAGEFGIGANNTVRINVGGNPTGTTIYVVPERVKNVSFISCLVEGTIDSNGIEGWGWQFDLGSLNCNAYRCLSANNEGGGFSCNVSSNNSFYGCLSYNNKKASFYIGGAPNCNITNCTSVSNQTLDNIYYVFGGTGVVKNTIVLGGLTGISAVSTGASVTEDYNCIYGAVTTRTNVSVGANSITTNPMLGLNYIPTTTSSVYHTGTFLGYLVDYLGSMYNTTPSMGAFEYSATRADAGTRGTR